MCILIMFSVCRVSNPTAAKALMNLLKNNDNYCGHCVVVVTKRSKF